MKRNPVVKNALAEFKENELIVASKLYKEKLASQISEAAYYKTLQRMCESGELVKIAKGTYHLPKVSKYGIVPPSEKEILSLIHISSEYVVLNQMPVLQILHKGYGLFSRFKAQIYFKLVYSADPFTRVNGIAYSVNSFI